MTGCSKIKSDLKEGTSKQIYISNKNKSFYEFCENLKYNYGTISDKYGLVTSEKIIKNYNLPPEDLTKEEKDNLKDKIMHQWNKNIKKIVFFGPRLLQSFTYLYLLKDIEAEKYLITSLKSKNYFKRKLI